MEHQILAMLILQPSRVTGSRCSTPFHISAKRAGFAVERYNSATMRIERLGIYDDMKVAESTLRNANLTFTTAA